jgi:hypothetical protein
MKNILLALLILSLGAGLAAQVLTCYDVQYTTNTNGNSPYMDQSVTVQGVVVAEIFYTGTSATNYGFVISDPVAGPWTGLLVFTNQYHPQRGDLVEVTGTIKEYYELTEMAPVTGYQVISSGNPIPAPATVTTGDLTNATTGEQWESVFVRVQNVNVTAAPNNYAEFYVNDGTGACQVDDQCFPRSGFTWPSITVGQNWARIQGVVDFSFSYYAINPRDLQDLVQEDTVANASILIQTVSGTLNQPVDVNVLTSRLKPQWYISSYTASVKIDPSKLLFHEVKITGTLSSFDPTVTVSPAGDIIDIVYQAQEPISSATDDQILFTLVLEPIAYGESVVQMQSFAYDNTNILTLASGRVLTKILNSIAYLRVTGPSGTKNIFNPALNEKITIEYGCKSVATGINTRAIMRIYDAQGRLVNTIVNKNISNSIGIEQIQWDGRDTNMKLLPIGVYYCHLEVIERSTGAKEVTVQPIVVKSTMK